MTDKPMMALPSDSPILTAWNEYKDSPEYANTRKWALHEGHVDGSLWAAFLAGHEAAKSEGERRG